MPTQAPGQVQQPLPIAQQPADMPAPAPDAPFAVTVVSYQVGPGGGYSFKFVGAGSGKAVGNMENGIGLRAALYDPVTQTLFPLTTPGTVYGSDGVYLAGTASVPNLGSRCFVMTLAGVGSIDQTPLNITPTPFLGNFFPNYYSECVAVDNGTPAGTQGNSIFTGQPLTGGESSGAITGQGQGAYLAGSAMVLDPALGSCCARGRAIKGDETVGDIGSPSPASDPLDPSPASNPGAAAVLWKGVPVNMPPVLLAAFPSMATSTNGSQQGGWASGHAVMWSGSAASMVDLNPPGYFDSRVTGMAAAFQVGDGWLGGAANSPGAVRHALLWRGSALSVVDLNQYLPASILGAAIDGVDIDGNIVGRMFLPLGTQTQELGVYFKANPTMSLASFTVSSSNPAPGAAVTGTVTLAAPAGPAGVLVSFTSSNPTLVPAPPAVMVPAGQSIASFNVASNATFFLVSPVPVTLTAKTSMTMRTAAMTVTPAPAGDTLVSLTLAASAVAPGDTVTVQANLAAPAPAAGVLVNFASSNPSEVPAPASVLIPAGQSSASVSVAANPTALFQAVAVVLQAQTGTSIQLATVTVASIPHLNFVTLGGPQGSFTSTMGGTTGTGMAVLSAFSTVPGTVALSSTNPALVVPASASIFAGNYYAGFSYSALPVSTLTTGTLSATLNGATVSTTISITPSPSPTIQTFRIPVVSNTQTWSSGQTLNGTIILSSPAFLGGMTVALSTDSPAAVQIPASVTLPSVSTTVTFPVTALAVSGPTAVTITATLPGFAGVSVPLTVIPGPALAISGYSLSPYSMIGPGVAITGTITLNQPAPAGGVTVALSAGNTSAAKFPATLVFPAGQSSATISIQGNSVSAATTFPLTASYTGPLAPLGARASTNLTVAPTDVLKAAKPTWSTSSHMLTVTATSTNPLAILTVLNASGNVPLGTMTSLGNGNYSFQETIASIASVNFKSNLGGATGQGVTIVP
ncbi:MAG TPA: hypothetical protein VGH38_20100 [Bryobacteraceae bacterium]